MYVDVLLHRSGGKWTEHPQCMQTTNNQRAMHAHAIDDRLVSNPIQLTEA